ncbi:type II toxin-antitoxin system VapC family toxin [Glycomyces xiaoerkulensis]|uniref:type II toxin-antitoxin system VapC family toxin n=1 Tax=Glycomyces xiaoerkulensis TaxID=2038139 RepID=UPI001E4078E5|nr:type II toxin-antitoxin system VapC family toxin [Glycomyces xiaoerkulensis]
MDASALVALYMGRDNVKDLRSFLKEGQSVPMATSTVGFVETVRTSSRHGQFPRLMSELDSAVTEIHLTDEVRDTAMYLPGRLRALDAIHVASALSIQEYLTALVSYDRRMIEIAREQGLPVASPGMD